MRASKNQRTAQSVERNGKQLRTLIEKSKATGIKTVIGDTAYSERDNFKYSNDNDIVLVAKLNTVITQGNRKKEDKFLFNKDAGMYVCKASHMAVRNELKHRHGYDVASSSGLVGMELQGAKAIFTVNLKRILKLMK